MSDNSMQIKISALIEGLDAIQGLSKQLTGLANDAKSVDAVDTALSGMGKSAQNAASDMDRAFQSLGGKSIPQLKAEIASVNAALESVKNSGTGYADVARASELAEQKIASLNAQIKNPAAQNFSGSLSELASKLKSLDFKTPAGEANGMNAALDGIKGLVGPIAAGFAALAGIKSLGELAQDSAKLAAHVTTLGVTMNVVGRNAGYSTEELGKQENALKKLGITTEAARSSLTNMIQAGIRVNEVGDQVNAAGERMTRAQELARMAQDLAVVSGENSSQTLQRLVLNIQQMDTMGLRFMGISVDRTAAEEQFAAKLGKTAAALSESEKKQAFLNATMTEGKKLQGAYVEALDTTEKKLGSLKRYQDEYLLSLGQNFEPAYGAMVDAVTEYLKVSQKTIESMSKQSEASKDLKDGMSALAGGIGDGLARSTKYGMSALTALSASFKAVADVLGPVIDVLLTVAGPALSVGLIVVADTIGILFAVVKDLAVLGFGGLIEALGMVMKFFGLFNKDADELGNNLLGFGQKLVAETATAKGGLVGLAGAMFNVGPAAAKLSNETKGLSAEINNLSKAQADGSLKGVELQQAYDSLATRIGTLGSTGKLSTKDLGDLQKQLTAVPGTLDKAFQEAAAGAKTSFGQITSGIEQESAAGASFMQAAINKAAQGTKQAFQDMGSSQEKFGSDFLATFAHFAEGAKSIQSLKLVTDELNAAQAAGIITEDQRREGLKLTTTKFEELLAAQIKSAKTKDDFDKLTSTIKEMQAAGDITTQTMERGLKAITAATKGATDETLALKKAQDSLTIADQSLAIARSRLEYARAESEVGTSQVKLWVAKNELSKDYNQLNKLAVQSAEIAVQLATAQRDLARIQYNEERAQMDVIIDKSKLRNALDKLHLDANDQVAKAEQIEAERLQVIDEARVTNLKTQADAQREVTTELQISKLQVDAQLEQTKLVTAEIEKNAKGAKTHAQAQDEAASKVKSLKDNVESVTTSMTGSKGLTSAQGEVGKGYAGMSSASTAWANGAVADANRVAQANANAAGVTGKFAGGNGTITNADGKSVNLPADTGVAPGSKGPGGSGNYTGASVTPFNDPVNGTVSAEQQKQANSDYQSMLNKYDKAGKLASQGGADTSILGKNDMKAVDNSGPFVAWDKFQAGDLTESDAALVKEVYKASKANWQMMQGHRNEVSFDGQQDTEMWFRRATQMMEKLQLRIPGLATGTNYVPKDMIAQLHEGEEVVPKQYNPNSGGSLAITKVADTLSGLMGRMSLGGAASSMQSLAKGAASSADAVVKKIQVQLMSGASTVNAMVNASDEAALFRILEQAKKVS